MPNNTAWESQAEDESCSGHTCDWGFWTWERTQWPNWRRRWACPPSAWNETAPARHCLKQTPHIPHCTTSIWSQSALTRHCLKHRHVPHSTTSAWNETAPQGIVWNTNCKDITARIQYETRLQQGIVWNTHHARTHARTHAHTHSHTGTRTHEHPDHIKLFLHRFGTWDGRRQQTEQKTWQLGLQLLENAYFYVALGYNVRWSQERWKGLLSPSSHISLQATWSDLQLHDSISIPFIHGN